MTKTTYKHWRDVPKEDWRWSSFSPEEIACNGTGEIKIDERALDMLQELRNRLGKPIILNSAYRSPAYNLSVGGAKASKHMDGIAFDCRMDNHNPQDFMDAARAVGFKGIGEYPTSGFTHIDARASNASWTGKDGKRWPPRRSSPAQSTTMQASATQAAAAVSGGAGAIAVLDGTAQIFALCGCVVVLLAAMWIMRERLKKWAEGIK